MMKTCNKCGQEKLRAEFTKAKSTKDGLRGACKACDAEYKLKYNKKNEKRIKAKRKADHLKNMDDPEYREKMRILAEKNNKLTHVKDRKIQWAKDNFDMERHLVEIRSAMKARGTKRCASYLELLGCTILEFMTYLESTWTEGMSWDNLGTWHVDHIKPCVSYDLTLDINQYLCFNYTNTQALWASDNIKKGNTYES